MLVWRGEGTDRRQRKKKNSIEGRISNKYAASCKLPEGALPQPNIEERSPHAFWNRQINCGEAWRHRFPLCSFHARASELMDAGFALLFRGPMSSRLKKRTDVPRRSVLTSLHFLRFLCFSPLLVLGHLFRVEHVFLRPGAVGGFWNSFTV